MDSKNIVENESPIGSRQSYNSEIGIKHLCNGGVITEFEYVYILPKQFKPLKNGKPFNILEIPFIPKILPK